jgi:predicted amidohydrolase
MDSVETSAVGRSIAVAAIQMNSQASLEENLGRAGALLLEAARRGARVAVLPENFAFMGEEADKRAIAEDLDAASGPIARALGDAARTLGIVIIAGGMPERSSDPERPFNTSAVFDTTGKVSARYRKIHLFDVDLTDGTRYRESASASPGAAPVVADLAGVRVGLSVCYDVRFPELYRALSSAGAEVLTIPAAFTLLTGKDHWHVLLRARAVENQCYVIAAAQWGKHPRGRQTFGKSCIIDPWGEIVAQASEGEGVVTGLIDRDYLRRVRENLPSLKHRVL